jgi:hypothetical protein
MKARYQFVGLPENFWSTVKIISAYIGYSKQGEVKILTPEQIRRALVDNIISTEMTSLLHTYFSSRANDLTNIWLPNMMTADEAAYHFNEYRDRYPSKCPIPHNSQRDREPRYLTALINILLEQNITGCNYDPRQLIRFIRNGEVLGVLSRRIDGVFPSCINPIALWEIKEFYRNKSYGSRVNATQTDTNLDGLEIKAARLLGVSSKHYLFIDAIPKQGIPLLCRLYDSLHSELVDEIICGREIFEAVPRLAKEWKLMC